MFLKIRLFYLILVWLAGSIAFFSCRKGNNSTTEPQGLQLTADISGRVQDEAQQPVDKARISVDGQVVLTNSDGVFSFKDTKIETKGAFLMVEKEGFFNTGKAIRISEASILSFEIQLLRKEEKGTFNAAGGGIVTITDNCSVQFPSNGMVNEKTKTAYTGTVSVKARYFDPTAQQETRPGGFTGLNSKNELKLLRSYGMVAVEPEGAAGDLLNLAPAKSATIRIPIPSFRKATAPSTLPLWYFDFKAGLWKEEGEATKQGDEYVGTVNHFSFWSFDQPVDMVNLRLTLKDRIGNPYSFYGGRITQINDDSSYVYFYTDSLGNINQAVPAHTALRLSVYSTCSEVRPVRFEQSIPALEEDADLGVVTTDADAALLTTIQGRLLDCNNSPLTDGYVEVSLPQYVYAARVNSQGIYQTSLRICPGTTKTVTITGINLTDSQQNGTPVLLERMEPGKHYEIPDIKACGVSLDQYIHLLVDGKKMDFLSPDAHFMGVRMVAPNPGTTDTSTFLVGTGPGIKEMNIVFIGPASVSVDGSHPLKIMTLKVPDDVSISVGERAFFVNITEYGPPGQYIEGNFSSSLYNNLRQRFELVNCDFRIRRSN